MKRKHFIYILAFLSFVLCIFFIQESYAKYLTSTSENASINVARWRILVNNKDIREGNTADAVIVPVFDGNENIASGIIAPTSEGYFDLVIDATEADVSFKYNISIASEDLYFSVNDDSAVSDLVATKYSINNGNVVDLNRDNQSITNEVLQANNTAPIYIRVYVIWDDEENSTMDNTADTEATKNGKTAKMNVNLSFIQLK